MRDRLATDQNLYYAYQQKTGGITLTHLSTQPWIPESPQGCPHRWASTRHLVYEIGMSGDTMMGSHQLTRDLPSDPHWVQNQVSMVYYQTC